MIPELKLNLFYRFLKGKYHGTIMFSGVKSGFYNGSRTDDELVVSAMELIRDTGARNVEIVSEVKNL
jgi:hypothetical protein